jgi:hypothetical protein
MADVLHVLPLQAKAMLATVRARDIAGKPVGGAPSRSSPTSSSRREGHESHRRSQDRVVARGSRLMDIGGADPSWRPMSGPTSTMSPGLLIGTGSRPWTGTQQLGWALGAADCPRPEGQTPFAETSIGWQASNGASPRGLAHRQASPIGPDRARRVKSVTGFLRRHQPLNASRGGSDLAPPHPSVQMRRLRDLATPAWRVLK